MPTRHRTADADSGSSRTQLIHPTPFRRLLVVLGRRSAPASASPSRGPGNGILWAETGGRFQAQNAGERPEFGSQTANCLTNRPESRGFLFTRKPRRFARTDGHRSLASLQNEAARRGFSARNDLSQRMSKSLAGKPKALTMNCYLPVSLRLHSLSSRSRAMVVTALSRSRILLVNAAAHSRTALRKINHLGPSTSARNPPKMAYSWRV